MKGWRRSPQSAGAVPGPVCYGRGGTEPTVTDANVVLGYLPSSLAGGEITLFNLNDTENGQEFSVKLQILIIMTLLGNAYKFTSKGEVRVSLEVRAGGEVYAFNLGAKPATRNEARLLDEKAGAPLLTLPIVGLIGSFWVGTSQTVFSSFYGLSIAKFYKLSTFSPLAIPETPVLATSSIGVPASAAINPSSLSLVPVSWMVYIVGVMSTTTPRKISVSRFTSARCAPAALTLMSIKSRSTKSSLLMS